MSATESFSIGGRAVAPGERAVVELSIPGASGHLTQALPVTVIHGRRPGPRVFVSAAIHGDEILGVEVIRRLLAHRALKRLRGTLVAVPVLNIYGFMQQSRYLPDRRDLNRSFPGSAGGSLAARLAHVFMTEVVERCGYGIDLHTAAIHRSNLPHLRICRDTEENVGLCQAWGAPVVLCSQLPEGSLRQAVQDLGKPMLLFEGGEALRIDRHAARLALNGILGVLATLGMVRERRPPRIQPVLTSRSYWVRAHQAGLFHASVELGAYVEAGQRIGFITEPFDQTRWDLVARAGGIVIGTCTNPVVNEGDGLFHIALFNDRDQATDVADAIGSYAEGTEAEPYGPDTIER